MSNIDVQKLNAGFPLTYAQQITYSYLLDVNDQRTSTTLAYSDLYNYYYYYSAVGCWIDEDPAKCQILGNLCVLQLYDEQATVCQLFEYITASRTEVNTFYNDAGWVDGMPWLYYEQAPSNVVQKSGRVDVTVSFSPSGGGNQSLTFFLARYAMNGTFLGF